MFAIDYPATDSPYTLVALGCIYIRECSRMNAEYCSGPMIEQQIYEQTIKYRNKGNKNGRLFI